MSLCLHETQHVHRATMGPHDKNTHAYDARDTTCTETEILYDLACISFAPQSEQQSNLLPITTMSTSHCCIYRDIFKHHGPHKHPQVSDSTHSLRSPTVACPPCEAHARRRQSTPGRDSAALQLQTTRQTLHLTLWIRNRHHGSHSVG